MTSTRALELSAHIIKNDIDLAGPVLQLMNVALTARGDPDREATVRAVMLFLYSKTTHCEDAMEEFIRSPLAA